MVGLAESMGQGSGMGSVPTGRGNPLMEACVCLSWAQARTPSYERLEVQDPPTARSEGLASLTRRQF